MPRRAATTAVKSKAVDVKSTTFDVLSLAPELVSEIFKQYLPVYPAAPPLHGDLSPTKLTQICGQWRSIALNTPALWRAFSIFKGPDVLRAGDAPAIFQRFEDEFKRAKLWAERSGPLPLSVRMWEGLGAYDSDSDSDSESHGRRKRRRKPKRSYSDSGSDSESPGNSKRKLKRSFKRTRNEAWTMLLSNRERLEYASLTLLPTWFEGQRHLRGSFPALRLLEVDSEWIDERDRDGPHDTLGPLDAPLLDSVVLFWPHLSYADLCDSLPWSQLTKLDLSEVGLNTAVAILRKTTNLVHFCLQIERLDYETPQYDGVVELTKLETFRLRPEAYLRISEDVLTGLRLPALKAFRIEDQYFPTKRDGRSPGQIFARILQRFGANIQRVVVEGKHSSARRKTIQEGCRSVSKDFPKIEFVRQESYARFPTQIKSWPEWSLRLQMNEG
uniref:F-box domain-containing protein n=1 Tax=Mycena chlorophos TaxID=658473 RepID=A0ABQ0LDP3_MYCCL|nr:predicted protein [Mycena chlorophos]